MMRLKTALMGMLMMTSTLARAAEDDELARSSSQALQRWYLSTAKDHLFFADAEKQTPLVMEPQAIMHWASPDDWSGDVFVWSRQGRPEILGCILAAPLKEGRRLVYREFHHLATRQPVAQELWGGRRWAPSEPGVTLRLLPGAPAVADNERARLQQMRTLAREFTAHTHHEGSPWELRLLPQPIYRYRAADRVVEGASWWDGALFTYVLTTGTDAEVVLLLEAVRVGNEWQWHYSPVRMSTRESWLKHRGSEVWRVEYHQEKSGDILRPYTTHFAGTISAADLAPVAP